MVKCVECGYLAARNVSNRGLDEVEDLFRDKGMPPAIYDASGHNPHQGWNPTPLCFSRCYDLIDEVSRLGMAESQKCIAVLSVITDDRQCSSFTKWHRGSTPKEHQEMMDRERRDKFEQEVRDSERVWREKQRDSDKQWQTKQQTNLVVVAGVFTLIGAGLPYLLNTVSQLIAITKTMLYP